MWPMIVLAEYVLGALAVVKMSDPGTVVVAVCAADVVMKVIRNSMIQARGNTLV